MESPIRAKPAPTTCPFHQRCSSHLSHAVDLAAVAVETLCRVVVFKGVDPEVVMVGRLCRLGVGAGVGPGVGPGGGGG